MEKKEKPNAKKQFGNHVSDTKIEKIIFGECSYFPDTKKVLLGGKYVHIPPTPSRILMYLCENQKKSITLQDIKENVWSKSKVDIADITVHTHLWKLRKSLGDNNPPHSYIVHDKNYGTYKLKPQAKVVYVKTEQERAEEKAANIHKVKKISVLVLVLVVMFSYWLAKPAPETKYKISDVKQFTTYKGGVRGGTVASDSGVIVFEYKKSGTLNWGLLAKDLDSERYSSLILDEEVHMHNREPSFSIDGKRLAWVRTNYKDQCAVMVADFVRHEWRIDNKKAVFDCAEDYYARFPQWKDENTLLASLPQGSSRPNAIFEIDLGSLKTTKITAPTGVSSGELGVFYNPINRKIAHLRRSNTPGVWSELMIYDYITGEDILLKSYPHPLYRVAWIDEEKLLAKGSEGLEVVELDGKTTPIDAVNMKGALMPFSLNNDWFGVAEGDLIAKDIEITNLVKGTSNDSLSSVRHDYRPVIAKYSGDIAFASMRSGRRQIYVTINGVPEPITKFKHHTLIEDMAISPDGELVAFVTNEELHIVNKFDTDEHVFKSNASVSGISFTLDGKGILWGENLNSGPVIRFLSFDSGEVKTVTHGFMPKATVDEYIYFMRLINGVNTLYRISTKLSVSGVFELGPAPFYPINSNSFDVIDGKLYYVVQHGQDELLIAEDLISGKIEAISSVSSLIFSLNSNATILVSAKKDEAQNNLLMFKLEQLLE